MLGICYGLQFLAHQLGGQVRPADRREYGHAQVELLDGSPLLAHLPPRITVWNSHGDEVEALPPGFRATGRTANAVAAMENPERRLFAVQFHPEVHHTPEGPQILRNFVLDICGACPDWTSASFIEETIARGEGAGGRRTRGLRLEWGRGFSGGGHAGPPGDWRAADLRLRRQRAAA